MDSIRRMLIVVLFSVLVFSGCAGALVIGGAALGASSILYAKGNLETTFSCPYDEVWDASLSALDDLGLKVLEQEKKPHKGSIKAERMDGAPIKLKIIPNTRKTTRVSVRVGSFGDEDSSMLILQEIWKNL